ncbi:astrotactin-2-like [Lethenteron reissneri]|uniref:astrotactin-2-like n=1 Tax=Lethenteron reissneri TaxID=7753 RepID=UPI0024CD6709|nr:astrotactin-2-like [Lethenteron reissneri]UYR28617.1 astrotactin [Lethenteron reissneri]
MAAKPRLLPVPFPFVFSSSAAAPSSSLALILILLLHPALSSASVAHSGCRTHTVTVSTLPVLRESEVAFTVSPRARRRLPPSPSCCCPSGTILPGELAIADDLENTELPYFVLEIMGPAEELPAVHWRQRWLENGTLHFRVLRDSVALRSPVAVPTLRPNSQQLDEQLHMLHVSVMGGLIALLLLLLLLTLALYTRRGGGGGSSGCCRAQRHRPPMPPQKSASAEAGDEIHYIPSVLLGAHGLDSRRSNARLLQDSHADADGTPVRETPILDDFDFENGVGVSGTVQRMNHRGGGGGDEDYGSQVTRTLESLGRVDEDCHGHCDVSPGRDETVESLVMKFKESFRANAPVELNRLQQMPTPCGSDNRRKRRRRSRSRGGTSLSRGGEDSGTDADDETQLAFYTEQHRGRRKSRGSPRSPVGKTTLALLSVTTCAVAMVCGVHLACPLTVRVTLHVPEQFVADGSVFVLSEGAHLDVSDWLNPAKVVLYRQGANESIPWVRDPCAERTLSPCEHLCDPETGDCSCRDGYLPDPVYSHLCVRKQWELNQGPWPYTTFESGYDLLNGKQPTDKIFRFTYGMGQGLWLPFSKTFVVPPVELDISPLASCRTDLSITEETAEVREEAMRSTHFESLEDLLDSFGPVRDCSRDNGGCTRNFHCVSERRIDSSGCVCPRGLRPMKDGSGCYDYRLGVDCSDGMNGGCEQLCLQQTVPLPDETSSFNILMFCSCVEEYRLGLDGRSCILTSEPCPDAPDCPSDVRPNPNETLFAEMLHGHENSSGSLGGGSHGGDENRTDHLGNGTRSSDITRGLIFRMTFRENNFMKDFPQLADGLEVMPLPPDQQCQAHLSDPSPALQQLNGHVNYSVVTGYPIEQHWTLRSNLKRVTLSTRTLSPGFVKAIGALSPESSRDEFLALAADFGSRFMTEALYGSERHCTMRFPSKRLQRQMWMQYQRLSKVMHESGGETHRGRDPKYTSFAAYISGLAGGVIGGGGAGDGAGIPGLEMSCWEKGGCPPSCSLCAEHGQPHATGPTPVLLEAARTSSVCELLHDNRTREACRTAMQSAAWCSGRGEVVGNWCRCDPDAFDHQGLPDCAPLPRPTLRLSPALEPTSTLVALEWEDLEPPVGARIVDFELQYETVAEPGVRGAEMHLGGLADSWHGLDAKKNYLSFTEDLLSGSMSPCVVIGRNVKSGPLPGVFTLIFQCLRPDTLHKFTLRAVDSTGRRSEPSSLVMRMPCEVVDDNKAEDVADRVHTLYNGYTSGKEQLSAYQLLMEVTPSALHRVQRHYNKHYGKFGDFAWRTEDELGPRKASLILRRLGEVSARCAALLTEPSIYMHTVSIPYLVCRGLGGPPPWGFLRPSDLPRVCEERWLSVLRNFFPENAEG